MRSSASRPSTRTRTSIARAGFGRSARDDRPQSNAGGRRHASSGHVPGSCRAQLNHGDAGPRSRPAGHVAVIASATSLTVLASPAGRPDGRLAAPGLQLHPEDPFHRVEVLLLTRRCSGHSNRNPVALTRVREGAPAAGGERFKWSSNVSNVADLGASRGSHPMRLTSAANAPRVPGGRDDRRTEQGLRKWRRMMVETMPRITELSARPRQPAAGAPVGRGDRSGFTRGVLA